MPTRRRRTRRAAHPLPVGFLDDSCGAPCHDTVIDPDPIPGALPTCFTAFVACGSAMESSRPSPPEVPAARYGGVWAGQLLWGKLTHARVLGVLNNLPMPERMPSAVTLPAAPSTLTGRCTPHRGTAPPRSGLC